MLFLCRKHRCWLDGQPLIAKQVWHKTMLDARDAVRNEDWPLAVKNYGSAFEIAALLLDHDSLAHKAQIRFTHSALELAYALVCNANDIDWLVHSVNRRLQGRNLGAPASDLLTALHKIKLTAANDSENEELLQISRRHQANIATRVH